MVPFKNFIEKPRNWKKGEKKNRFLLRRHETVEEM